ncbi:MAG: glycosyltransferase, partial [Bacteroidota bacterium]
MSTQKKKVLFLITKSNWGGAQRYVHDLALALSPERYDIVVAHGGDGEMATKLRAAGIKTVPIHSLKRDITLKKELSSFRDIYQLLRDERPDILHVNSSKAGGIGAFLGRICGVPRIIYTAHGWAFNEDRSVVSKCMVGVFHWLTIIFSHQTIAVSETTKQQMRWPFTHQKMTVVHNGREIPVFVERTTARDIIIKHCPDLAQYSNDFWSVTVAELHPIKQHEVTIQALRTVVQSHPDIRHVLIGDGEERESLERLIRAYNLHDHVFLTGSIDEAAQYLHAFDLFVLSSRSEALAYVIIEACFAGLPIISSRVGGIPEIIT